MNVSLHPHPPPYTMLPVAIHYDETTACTVQHTSLAAKHRLGGFPVA